MVALVADQRWAFCQNEIEGTDRGVHPHETRHEHERSTEAVILGW